MNIELRSEPDLLTSNDLSRLLKLSAGRVRIMLREGTLPGVKIGHSWYVPKSELEKLLCDKLGGESAC